MPMNLVIVPLEGMSQLLLWQYRNAMPALWRIYRNSVAFRRFYTNSTSAFQSFCDFAFGDSSELDHNLRYPEARGCLLGRVENFFDILRKNGYRVMGAQHAETSPAYARDNFFGAWPDSCGEFRRHGEYDSFFRETADFIEDAKRADEPFALYYSDRASTIADDCAEKKDVRLYHERFEKGFSLLDDSLRRLFEKLAEHTLLPNTVIALYGPYGMDPWKHGVYDGRTRAMDPYSDVSWTPFCLFNNGRDAKTVDALASVIDIKDTLLGLLFPDSARSKTTAFSGLNLLAGYRDVVITQNLFALEQENDGPARGLRKCYAATDGDQRLIVTSNGGVPGEGGMELYYDPRDPSNSRNLLDFFPLNDAGKMHVFGHPAATHSHFFYCFRPDKPEWLLKTLMASYNTMRDVLKKFVHAKEEEALRHCPNPQQAVRFDDRSFNYKRARQ